MDKSDGIMVGSIASYLAVVAADWNQVIMVGVGLATILVTVARALNLFADYRKKLREMDK